MKRWLIVLAVFLFAGPSIIDIGVPRCLACPSCRWSPTIRLLAQEPPVLQLSDMQRLRGEVVRLKAENAQLSVRLAGATETIKLLSAMVSRDLSAEEAALIADYRITLKPAPEALWDWASWSFKLPEKPKEPEQDSPAEPK